MSNVLQLRKQCQFKNTIHFLDSQTKHAQDAWCWEPSEPPINHQVITSAWNYFNNLSVYLLFSTVYSCTCYFFPVSIFFSTSFNELHPLPFPPGPHALFHRGWRQITTATPLGNSVPIPSHLLSTQSPSNTHLPNNCLLL